MDGIHWAHRSSPNSHEFDHFEVQTSSESIGCMLGNAQSAYYSDPEERAYIGYVFFWISSASWVPSLDVQFEKSTKE